MKRNLKIVAVLVLVLAGLLAVRASAWRASAASLDAPGPRSLSGSAVTLEPALMVEPCYRPGETQTLCFRVDAYTTDWEWVRGMFMRFPQDWRIVAAWDAGPNLCTNGGHFLQFQWDGAGSNVFHTPQAWKLADPDDHCTTTMCVRVAASAASTAAVSWYVSGDAPPFSSAPHEVCSSDGYVPEGWNPCAEAVAPPVSIPACPPSSPPVADVEVAKHALADTVQPGAQLGYTIAVRNAGPDTASEVTLVDLLPPGTRVASITAANPASGDAFCSLDGRCSLGTLPGAVAPGAFTTANNTAGTADGSIISRTALVGPDDLPARAQISDVNVTVDFQKISGQNCALTDGDGPWNREIMFYLTSPAGTRVVLVENGQDWGGSGQGVTYEDLATSGGPVTVTFDDAAASTVGEGIEYPVSGTFRPVQPLSALNGESPFGPWTLTIGDSQVDDALCFSGVTLEIVTGDVQAVPATVDLVLKVDSDYAAGTLVNEARVWAAEIDPSPADNADAVTTLVQPEADLGIEKSALYGQVCLGASGLYELAITNAGPSLARNVVVTDELPDTLVYAGGSRACALSGQNPDGSGGTVTCAIEALDAGGRVTFLTGFALAPGVAHGTAIDSEATVSSDTPEPAAAVLPNTASATVTAVTCNAVVDLSLVKTAPATAMAGGTLDYTLEVWNQGPTVAPDVVVTDTLPAAVAFLGASAGCVYQETSHQVTCSVGSLGAGASATLSVLTRVDAATEPGTSVENRAVAVSSLPEARPVDNAATADTSIVGVYRLRTYLPLVLSGLHPRAAPGNP